MGVTGCPHAAVRMLWLRGMGLGTSEVTLLGWLLRQPGTRAPPCRTALGKDRAGLLPTPSIGFSNI